MPDLTDADLAELEKMAWEHAICPVQGTVLIALIAEVERHRAAVNGLPKSVTWNYENIPTPVITCTSVQSPCHHAPGVQQKVDIREGQWTVEYTCQECGKPFTIIKDE
jgi:hypothetical protein